MDKSERRVAELEDAARELWPHLTGHCFEGATPECFGKMRAIVSAVMRSENGDPLPYSDESIAEAEAAR